MIKQDIVRHLHEIHGGLTMEEAEHYTDTLINLLKEAMSTESTLTIAGFGRFRHKRRSVREVVMPDGEHRLTTGGERIQFLPSPRLKAFINAAPVMGKDETEENR